MSPSNSATSSDSAISSGSSSPASSATSISADDFQEAVASAVKRTKIDCHESQTRMEDDYKHEIDSLSLDLEIMHQRYRSLETDMIDMSKKHQNHEREYAELRKDHDSLISKHESLTAEHESTVKELAEQIEDSKFLEIQTTKRTAEWRDMRDVFTAGVTRLTELHNYLASAGHCFRTLGIKFWQVLLLMDEFDDDSVIPAQTRKVMISETETIYGCDKNGNIIKDWDYPPVDYLKSFLELYPKDILFSSADDDEANVDDVEKEDGRIEEKEMDDANKDEHKVEGEQENSIGEEENGTSNSRKQNTPDGQDAAGEWRGIIEGRSFVALETLAAKTAEGSVLEVVEAADEDQATRTMAPSSSKALTTWKPYPQRANPDAEIKPAKHATCSLELPYSDQRNTRTMFEFPAHLNIWAIFDKLIFPSSSNGQLIPDYDASKEQSITLPPAQPGINITFPNHTTLEFPDQIVRGANPTTDQDTLIPPPSQSGSAYNKKQQKSKQKKTAKKSSMTFQQKGKKSKAQKKGRK